MGLFRDLWRQKGSLQVVRATCHYYFSLSWRNNFHAEPLVEPSPWQVLYWPIIRYLIVKEATIRIAKTTIHFSTNHHILPVHNIPSYRFHLLYDTYELYYNLTSWPHNGW